MNEITYHIEITDMLAFHRHLRRKSPVIRWLYLLLLLFMVILSLDAAIRTDDRSVVFRIVFFFVILGVMLLLTVLIFLTANWLRRFFLYCFYRYGKFHGVLGEHTIKLLPEALHESTSVNDSNALWRGIYRIDSTANHIFIFTQPNASHIIPRRAFSTLEDSEKFLAAAREYYLIAKKPDLPDYAGGSSVRSIQ